MKPSIQALRERLAALNQKMKALLAEKGDRAWSKEDQAVFDADSDEAERLQRQISAHQKMLDQEAEDNFEDADKKPKAGEKTALQKGVDIFMRKRMIDLSAEERAIVLNTMSTTTGSEGGYTVQTEVARQFIEAMKAFGSMRRVSTVLPTGAGNNMSFPTTDGTGEIGEIVAQNIAASTADLTFGTKPLNVFKFGSRIVTIPIELLQDTEIDIVGLINKRLRDRLGRVMNLKFTVGAGTTEPDGIVPQAMVGKTGTTGQTLTIIYDDLVDLVDALDIAYLEEGPEPGWMMSQTMRRVVRKIKDTTGRPIWTPGYEDGITAKTPDLLLGYPVTINNDMAVPAANAKSLAFGDFSGYTIRDAMEVNLFRFDDSAFMSKGQVGFLAWARAGGNLMDTARVRTYQHSAT